MGFDPPKQRETALNQVLLKHCYQNGRLLNKLSWRMTRIMV